MLKTTLQTAMFLLLMPSVISNTHAGTIDEIFCENGRFVVVASPNTESNELCFLTSDLTLNGVEDAPKIDVIFETGSEIALRRMEPSDIASVTFQLLCETPNQDTITEVNDEDTTADCRRNKRSRRSAFGGGQGTPSFTRSGRVRRNTNPNVVFVPGPTVPRPIGPSRPAQFTPGVSIAPGSTGVNLVNGQPSNGTVPVGIDRSIPSISVPQVPAALRSEAGQRRQEQFIICNANPNSSACAEATRSFNDFRRDVARQFLGFNG